MNKYHKSVRGPSLLETLDLTFIIAICFQPC